MKRAQLALCGVVFVAIAAGATVYLWTTRSGKGDRPSPRVLLENKEKPQMLFGPASDDEKTAFLAKQIELELGHNPAQACRLSVLLNGRFPECNNHTRDLRVLAAWLRSGPDYQRRTTGGAMMLLDSMEWNTKSVTESVRALADSEGGTAEAAQMYLLHYAGYSVEDFAPIYLRRSEDCGFSEFLKLDPDFRVPMRRTEAGAKDEHKYKYVYVAQEMARAIGGGAVIPAASGRRLLRRQDMWVAFGETALALPEGKKESLAWLAELGIMEAKTEPNRPEYRPRWQEADLEKLTEIGVKARQRLGAQAPRPKGGKEEK